MPKISRTDQDAETFFSAFNLCAAGAISGDRTLLARGLRLARQFANKRVYSECAYHASFIGWPVKKRPNGRYI